jgi:ribonucleoside-triphosphate reductase
MMKAIGKISHETDRDNANVGNNSSSKMLQIGSTASKASNLLDMPDDIVDAYENGYIHIHDLDFLKLTINCLNIDTGEILDRGFNTGYGTINPPKRIEVAAELSCIVLQSSQNDMFGGQNHYNFDNDMAKYVKLTRKEINKKYTNLLTNCSGIYNELSLDKEIEQEVSQRVHQAMQTIVYNLNSMHSRAGSQVPFSSINLGLPYDDDAALVCQAFLEEFNKGLGKGEPPIFPNVVFRLKKGTNLNPGNPYYYLKQLAIKVASNRMNPTFLNCDASYNQGFLPAVMGCRTRIASNVNGPATPCKRGNIAPVSINLPRLAIEAAGDCDEFEKGLDRILNLCEWELLCRFRELAKLKGKDLPFVIGQKLIMGAEEVGPDDSIDPVLRQGTWAIGFIGLAEAMTSLFGKHHGEDPEILKYAIKTIEQIRAFCDKATAKYHLNFTCYATPAEGLSGRFVKIDQKEFGTIKGVTDKDYYTNSFHVPVGFNISMTKKADIEAPFHKLCNAGHISYFEFDAPPVNNPESVERLVDYIVNNTDMGYFGINFGIRYCKQCGLNHIQGNKCPRCKSTDIQGVYRVTGYLSLAERFTPGKTAERKDRIAHKME